MSTIMRTAILQVIFFFLMGVCLGQGRVANTMQLPETSHKISFSWKQQETNGVTEPHAALLLPVQLPNCPGKFYMQFDMGAPNTLFYANKLKAIGRKYPGIMAIDDSVTRLQQLAFRIGKMPVQVNEVQLIRLGDETIDETKQEIIGTIGSDLVDNRTILIHYPREYLVVNYAIPEKYTAQLTDFTYVQRNILFPAIIRGKKTALYFDSGSSAFGLLTSKETVLSMAVPGAELSRIPVSSWGRTLYANSIPTHESITIAGLSIPLLHATYIDGASEEQVNRMLKLGIGGMTGNKLFLKTALIVDTKNKKFLLVDGKHRL